jgi:hypothetical protein
MRSSTIGWVVEQVAFDDVDPGRKISLGGIADKSADAGAALDELVDDEAADGAGGAEYENGHGKTPVGLKSDDSPYSFHGRVDSPYH